MTKSFVRHLFVNRNDTLPTSASPMLIIFILAVCIGRFSAMAQCRAEIRRDTDVERTIATRGHVTTRRRSPVSRENGGVAAPLVLRPHWLVSRFQRDKLRRIRMVCRECKRFGKGSRHRSGPNSPRSHVNLACTLPSSFSPLFRFRAAKVISDPYCELVLLVVFKNSSLLLQIDSTTRWIRGLPWTIGRTVEALVSLVAPPPLRKCGCPVTESTQ